MINTKTIFIAPLNWGLGHATRCIPIINHLKNLGHKIILGSDGGAFQLLQLEFPGLPVVELPGYGITYPDNDRFTLHMIQSSPKILSAIRQEKKELDRIVKEHRIDLIISDNRYGMFHENAKSIIITHQPNILAPVFSSLVSSIHKSFLNKFDEIWIPDIQEMNGLSGQLSHPVKGLRNVKYVGVLSRFSQPVETNSPQKEINKPYILAILSGPEPQRSIFEHLIIKQAKNLNHHVVIVGGQYQSGKPLDMANNMTYIPFASGAQLHGLITHSTACISRSGYSSIMDYMTLRKSAIIVPTPGQIEQVYLADYLSQKGLFMAVSQKQFNLKEVLSSFKTFQPDFKIFDSFKNELFYDLLNNI